MKIQSVLIIGAVWIEPSSSAAGSRMLQLIEQFVNQNWKITFCSTAQKTEKATDLVSLGIEEFAVELNNVSFDDFITKLNPTIVVFDRFLTEEQFGWRIAENLPNAFRILDTEDLHCLRKARELVVKNNSEFSISNLLSLDITKREIAAILRCDLSLIISSYEMSLLTSIFKIDDQILYELPFLLDKIEEKLIKKWNTFEERKHFIFIGNFYHKPNVDAVLQLKKNIWPTLKKEIPEAELHIYGAYVNQQILDVHNPKEGFMVKGFAENAKEVISSARVMLAPLRFGAGLKGKLVEAMLCGTPSVTTQIGAESMYADLSWNGFISDDFKVFVNQSIQLYQKKSTWQIAQLNGVEIINKNYDKEQLGALFIEKIEAVYQNLEPHRTQNFIGNLLQYQTLQATKYMSKWIETKNQLNR